VAERPFETISATDSKVRDRARELPSIELHRRIMTRMFFRQVLHEDLGCASYVLADAGEAAVIDPKWEIDEYLALADEHGFEFRHILETHNHADHVSGKGRLAKATSAFAGT
jgi:glyoxylase-like metal-dependent hydrolase (beta-lactamase superfamily II)